MRRCIDMLALFTLMACLHDASNKDSALVPGETAVTESCTDCVLSDAHNFSYQGVLDVASVAVQSYENIRINWSQLNRSLQGKSIDPMIVDEALLLIFPRLRPSEIMDAFARDALEQSDIGLYMRCISSDAQCLLDDFGLLGSYPGLSDYFTAEEGSWLVILQNENVLGAVSLLFLEPDPESTSTEAFFDNDSSSLEIDVDLHSGTPLYIPRQTPWTLDWSLLRQTGQGNDLDLHRINRLELGRYTENISTLEERFFELPDLAIESESFDVEGESETALPPLDGEGVWLLVLWCDNCDNPVPPFIGRILLED